MVDMDQQDPAVVLPTYAGYGLPRVVLQAQLRAEQWGWTNVRMFRAVYEPGASCHVKACRLAGIDRAA